MSLSSSTVCEGWLLMPKSSFFSLSLVFAFLRCTWTRLGKWSHPFLMLTHITGAVVLVQLLSWRVWQKLVHRQLIKQKSEMRSGPAVVGTDSSLRGLPADCSQTHLRHHCKIKVQDVSFMLSSGWIFSGLVHFKLIVLPSILNTF